jgi:hypothetical protein
MSSCQDLVIDADIMRAASTSEAPLASNAKKALDAIRDGKHRMVWCGPLIAEYKKHKSRYSATWRANMISRRLHRYWDYSEDAALRKTLVKAQPEDGLSKEIAVLKDAHLLEAAKATGGRIISKDATARNLFRRACPHLGSYKKILWGDLTGLPEDVISWEREGCSENNDFRICPITQKKH